MFCLGCGYHLKRLTQPACPECGRGFDARDTRSWGSARAFRLRRYANAAGWLAFVASAGATALGFGRVLWGADPAVVILIWMAALLPVSALLLAWLGCLVVGEARPRVRAGVCALAVVVLNASYFTHWPADVGFALSRDALRRSVQQAHAGALSGPGPWRIGIYRVQHVSVSYKGSTPGAVVFALNPASDGPDSLVYGLSDAEVEARFLPWSYHRLDADWHIVHED